MKPLRVASLALLLPLVAGADRLILTEHIAVMDLLTKVAVREDRAVIVVTHDSRVFEFADRIAHMDDGRIVKTEAPQEALFTASVN